MRYVAISSGEHQLGSRLTELDHRARTAVETFMSMDDVELRQSQRRRVTLPAFEIATTAVPLLASAPAVSEDELYDCLSIAEVCDALDAALADQGLRVPTEDEYEAAAGAGLFWWGDTVPDGSPYGSESSSSVHRGPSARGMQFDADPYKVELTRAALKCGDGGEAVCGGYPWPVGWLPLTTAHRLTDGDIEDAFEEFLEGCLVRPVRV